jgi:archaellum biogenesis protein FlaJ (TadC family)
MGILGKLFGSTEVITKGMKLIDDLHTSDEEEIRAKSKAKTDLLEAYAPFKLAQRYLAVMFSVTYLITFIMVMGMSLAGMGNVDVVRDVISEFYIGEILLTIVAFYFAGGTIASFAPKGVIK